MQDFSRIPLAVLSTPIQKLENISRLLNTNVYIKRDDLTGIGLLLGQAIGRWGNFFNREAHGGVTTCFLRMGLVENGALQYFHPTFLYESVWNLTGFVVLHFLSKKRKFDGQMFLAYLAWYGAGRMVIEGLRTDSLYLFSTGIRVSFSRLYLPTMPT